MLCHAALRYAPAGSELPPLQVPVTLAGRPTQRSSDSFYGEEGEGQASGSANTLSQVGTEGRELKEGGGAVMTAGCEGWVAWRGD